MINIEYPGGSLSIPAEKNLSFSQLLFINGFFQDRQLCSGLGKCGKCRVIFPDEAPLPTEKEAARFGQEEIDRGARLSCLHRAFASDIEMDHPPLSKDKTALPKMAKGMAMGVDLGTTSICWQEGENLKSTLNPQAGLGSEIMSRMAFAQKAGSGDILRKLAVSGITGIFHRTGSRPEKLCVAGNSAQTYLLLGMDTSCLATAPYGLNYAGGDEREIFPGVTAYIPPLIAPFVGADLSAGLAWLMLEKKLEPPFVLADLGTNGEFILVRDKDNILATSIPMGPALEGAGLSLGTLARPGAASGFSLTPAGITPVTVGNREWNKTITGTGYLSMTSGLKTAGILDPSGRFASQATTPFGARLLGMVDHSGSEPRFMLDTNAGVPASDFEEILKIKAAFNLALATLFKASGLGAKGIGTLALAGALGEHVNTGNLENLGFIPQALKNKTLPMGNTSLKGATLLAKEESARKWIKNKAKTIKMCHPQEDGDFDRQFISRMVFNYVH